MKTRVRIADTNIIINTLYADCHKMFEGYIISDDQSFQADIIIDISVNDLKRENEEYQSQECKESKGLYLYNSPEFLEPIAVHRKVSEVLPNYDVFLMHGAVVEYEGKGYMFVAPSGVGKSTRVKLWTEVFPKTIVVNGDKPFVRIKGDDVYAYGSPWCGKENWNTNIGVPLYAIFLLQRADKQEKTEVSELYFPNVYSDILKQVYIPEDSCAALCTLRLVKKLVERVRIFRFRSEPTHEAVKLAWEAANE